MVADASVGVFTGEGVRALTSETRQQVLADNHELAGRALRVLALAYKTCPTATARRTLSAASCSSGWSA